MTGKRIVFMAVLFMIAFGSYIFMNKDYDPLARYQYQLSDEQHEQVIANLSTKEIEYLIEYAIAPEEFIDYVGLDGFNIYLLDYYNEMFDLYGWIESKPTIMSLVNVTKDIYSKEELKAVINDYYIYEILTYYEDGNTEKLALQVNNVGFVIPADKSIGYYVPKDLLILDDKYIAGDNVSVRLEVATMIESMFNDLKQAYPRTYKKVKVARGYLSYQQLESLYQTTNDQIYKPAHSEYQLGLVIDLLLDDEATFVESDMGQWIMSNASKYGFIAFNDIDDHSKSYRYVGVALAEQETEKDESGNE